MYSYHILETEVISVKRIICMFLVLCLMIGNFAPAAHATQIDSEIEDHLEQNVSDISQKPEPTVEQVQEKEIETVTVMNSAAQDFTYTVSGETTCTITGYTGNDADIVVPEMLDGYTVTSIGEDALSGKHFVKTVDLPDTVESIGRAAFWNCAGLTRVSLPSSLKTIGSYSFNKCTALTEIEIPGSLGTIASEAFTACSSLQKVTIGEGCKEIQWKAFAGCTALQELNLPSTLTNLDYCVFSGCTSLVSVELPDSITSMGYGTFMNCTALEQINFPLNWTKTTRDNALHEGQIFIGCEKLKRLDIPEGVTTIPYKAFVGCSNFTTVTLPSTLKSIGFAAFSGCTGLTEIILPEGLTTLGGSAFQNCDGLTEIVIPGSLLGIASESFVSCNALRKVTIEEGSKEIEREAFSGCTALEEVNMPSTLTAIGTNAFSGCSALVSVELPDAVTSIGYGAFRNCSALEQINFPLNWTTTTPKDLSWGCIFEGCSKLTRMVVPEGVETIPLYAFFRAESLQEVVLPSTVKSIGRVAFGQCTSLESIGIPESVTQIDSSAFSGCRSLKEITIPAGVRLDSEVFVNCSALTGITIPVVEHMGTAIFSGCTGLRWAIVEEGMTTLPENTFSGCTALNDIRLPDSLTSIEKGAFGSCRILNDPILPNSLNSIGSAAFSGCTGLNSLFVPNSVGSIASDAFNGCTNLTLYCGKQSYGATYAIAQGIPLEFYDGEWTSAGLDRNNSWFRINMDSVSAAGYLSVITGYEFQENVNPKNMELYFYIPKEAGLIESTMTLDGATCTDYTISGTTLTIPVTEKTGVVRFSLKPEAYARVTTYAGIKYTLNNKKYNDVIDTIYVEMPILSISAIGETASDRVVVSGVTMPGNSVTLFVEDEEQVSVAANKAGDYSAAVTLRNLSNGKRYDIIARTVASDGTSLSSRTTVTYREDSPTVTKFDISHNGWNATLEEAGTSRPVFVFNPTQNFRFEVDFNVTSAISKVFIVSTRNNISKFMVANWNGSTGTYIAEGYFDDNDHAYVPGVISVQYVLDNGEVSLKNGYDFTTEEAQNAVPDSWKDAAVDVLVDTEEQVQYVVQTEDGSSVRVTTTKQNIPEGLTRENAAEHGYSRTVDKHGTELYVRRYEKPDAYEYDVISFLEGYAVTQVLDKCVGLGTQTTVYGLADTMREGVSNDVTYQQMAKDIYKSNLSTEQKQAALKELDDARACNTMINVTRTVYSVATPAIEAMALAALAVPGIGGVLMGSLLLVEMIAMEAMLESANNVTLWRMSNMMYQIQEFDYTFVPRWTIDPSGYVYDAETQERIAGATVTAYWIPYDEKNEGFWDNLPADDVYGTVWDATEYSQKNPLNTGLDGRYAWDVPEGWWRVKCEAECHETAWSEWLPVPPPQMDVNIALIPGAHKWKDADCTTPKTCTNCGLTVGEVADHSYTDDKDTTCDVCGYERQISSGKIAVYRLYNPYTHEHLLTGGEQEKSALLAAGWSLDGVAWHAPETGIPVYRLYNPYDDWHTYTTDVAERDAMIAAGWTLDGAVSCSAPATGRPIYRLYNPYVKTNFHMFTASDEERDTLVDAGWLLEGVAWYALN